MKYTIVFCCVLIHVGFTLAVTEGNDNSTVYDEFGRNPWDHWHGMVLSINGEDLKTILDTKPQTQNQNLNESALFLYEYDKFLLSFYAEDDFNTDIIRVVAEHNKVHNSSPLELWISYEPSGSLFHGLNMFLDNVKTSSISFPETVSMLLLDYKFQEPGDQATSLVNQEMETARNVINQKQLGNLELGLIFDIDRCKKQKKFFPGLNIQKNDSVIFMPRKLPLLKNEMEFDLVFIETTVPCFSLKNPSSTSVIVAPVLVFVNPDTAAWTFSINYTLVFDYFNHGMSYTLKFRQQSHITRSYDVLYVQLDSLNSTELNESSTAGKGILNPIKFKRPNIGVTIRPILGLNTTVLVHTMVEKFNKILFVEAWTTERGHAPVMDQIIKEFAVEQLNLLRGAERYVNVYNNIPADTLNLKLLLQININLLNLTEQDSLIQRAIHLRKIGDEIYPRIMDSVLVNWLPDSVFRRGEGVPIMDFSYCENNETTQQATALLNFVKRIKSENVALPTLPSLRVGIIVNLKIDSDIDDCNRELALSIVEQTDYHACKIIVLNENIMAGAEKEFESLKEDILYCRATVYHFKENPIYIISVQGCSGQYQKYEDLKEFLLFWKLVSEWAELDGETVFMDTGVENVIECLNSSSALQNIEAYGQDTCGWWLVNQSGESSYTLEDKESVARDMVRASQKVRREMHYPVNTTDKLILLILIPVMVVGLLICAVVFSLVFYYRSKYLLSREEAAKFFAGQQSPDEELTSDSENGSQRAESRPYNKEKYELSPSSFNIDASHPLGSGEFGQVFLGSIKRGGNNSSTAVKMAKPSGSKNLHGFEMALKGLMSEIKILSYAGQHKNIIGLLGARTVNLRCGEVLVFLEFCEMGSLEKYLRSFEQEHGLTNVVCIDEAGQAQNEYIGLQAGNELCTGLSNDLHRWSDQIASGLEFLASKKIVHADIATRNILLDSVKCVKISDFGLSRRMYAYTGYVKESQEPLPWRWMSPESLQRLIFNEKSDVWAFGVTLWEMYTLGDIPYPGMSWDVNFVSLLEDGLRLGAPKYNEREMYSVMMRCWDIEPARRPAFSELKSILLE